MIHMTSDHVAHCGMNCGLCVAFQREKNPCGGCRTGIEGNAKPCSGCVVRTCEKRLTNHWEFCYDCINYPCKKLVELDEKHNEKYGVSPIRNLDFIKENGIESFVTKEVNQWTCLRCGATLCMHGEKCAQCGKSVRK